MNNFEIQIGSEPSSYENNSVCATGVAAPRSPPYSSDVCCNGMGRCLFVVIPGNNKNFMLREVQVISDFLPGGFSGLIADRALYARLESTRRHVKIWCVTRVRPTPSHQRGVSLPQAARATLVSQVPTAVVDVARAAAPM